MPSLYAHNKFGKLVIPKLSKPMKETIKKYPRSFRIGLQGPDFLFFYQCFCKNKINQIGVKLHHKDAYTFMQHAVEVIRFHGQDSPEYSYILGFICHFALDNTCHPYVSQFMKSSQCGHVEIEGDLDQLMLSLDGYAPEYYPMYRLIPTDYNTARSMAPFYSGISTDTIYTSLKYMHLVKRLFTAPGIFKRTAIDLCMRLTFHYKRFNGHMIVPHSNKKCRRYSLFLYRKLKHTVPEAVRLIHNFNNAQSGKCELSHKFHKDFNGNMF